MKNFMNYVKGLRKTFKECRRVTTNLDEYYVLQSVHYMNTGIL